MISIYELKPAFQKLLRPVVRALARSGVSANQVTLGAVALSFLVGLVLVWQKPLGNLLLLVPSVLLVRMALNAIDGMLAREHGMQSKLGAILNELGDVFSDLALYLPLALLEGFSPTLVVLFVVLSIISEMTGVLGVLVGSSRGYEGPMGKSDRAFFIGLLTLLLATGIPVGMWVSILFLLSLFLLIVTIFNRARTALREMEEE